ncbi:unnamed protein product [Plutella xylostella]|uniref:L-serine deaminase n=1 Tax=Plutella xylostella TaxID=51655 RepID=A0A8S4FVS5_PLUXY|nr:unnamed protein product [Plutella xylostella]
MAPARSKENLDENSDPEHPKILNFDDVTEASARISKMIERTPCIPSHYQKEFVMHLTYKMETMHKSGSFKERGAANVFQLLPENQKKIGIAVASTGNFATSMCMHAAKAKVPVTVVMPVNVPVARIMSVHDLGGKVLLQGNNLLEAQKFARFIAQERGLEFINSRDHPAVLAGYGSLAVEIIEDVPLVDAILVPLGSGGLAAAVATAAKHLKPDCLVYGISPEAMPVFFKALEGDNPSLVIEPTPTSADAIAVTAVGVNSYQTAKPLMDKLLMVKEEWITKAMTHLLEQEKMVVEGSGACPLAAIIGNLVPELKTKHVVCVLSGGNVDPIQLSRGLQRGLAAFGRLIRFSVDIGLGLNSSTQLLRLLAGGGYNVVSLARDLHRVHAAEDVFKVQVKLACETKSLEHALELKRLLDRAYPDLVTFDTAPFNDRTTCPCFIKRKKSSV